MTHHRLPSATRGLIWGLDLLIATLMVVTVVQAPAEVRWPTAVVGAVFSGVYVWGRRGVRVHRRAIDAVRGSWWPDGAWVTGLMIPWLFLLWLSPGALWIAFPIMLLQMHVLGPRRGIVAVAVTLALAVAEGVLVHAGADDPWTGFVLGPLIGAGVAVGVVLGIEAFVRESHTRQRTVDELTQARRHLAQAERERAITDERARLARDIHDTLAQSLSAIELLLRTAEDAVGTDDSKARTLISQSRDASRESLADARRVVQDLTPADLESTTLLGALRRAAEHTAGAYNDSESGRERPLAVSVHTNGSSRSLPVQLETALLRIVQSALANVVQHANATRAQVTITYEPDAVTLDVVDDGEGFDATVASTERTGGRGYGISSVRSRVYELGGTFALETSHGNGTALAITLPTQYAEDA